MVIESAETDRPEDQEADSSRTASPGIVELEATLERTREDLAQTVDKLAAKFDVKTRFRAGVAQARDNASRQLRDLRNRAPEMERDADPCVVSLGVGVLTVGLAVLGFVVWRRRRARRRWAWPR